MTDAFSVAVTAWSETPASWILIVPKIIGSRADVRRAARSFVTTRPEIGVLISDVWLIPTWTRIAPAETLDEAAALVLAECARAGTVIGAIGEGCGANVAYRVSRTLSVRDFAVAADDIAGVERLAAMPIRQGTRAAWMENAISRGFSSDEAAFLALNLHSDDERVELNVPLAAWEACARQAQRDPKRPDAYIDVASALSLTRGLLAE